MTKQLNIRSDEVYRLAHKVAADMGKARDRGRAVPLLRAYRPRLPEVENSRRPQRATYERLRALAREACEAQVARCDLRP